MQFHGERLTMAGDRVKLKSSDFSLPYMGSLDDRTLYVQNIPETWDKIQFVRERNSGSPKAEFLLAVEKETERMKSYFSIDKLEPSLVGGNIRKPIIYNERLHRHMYLPWGEQVQTELIKPISESMQWPMIFYVLAKTHVCETENFLISNEDLDGHIVAHFKRAAQVKHVVKDELLVAAPKGPYQLPLRCRVLEELDNEKVRIYALDVGQTLVVQMSELKVISEYLASVPARAVPCVLYGITKPTAAFGQVASRLLENIKQLVILVVSFKGAIALVRAFELNGSLIREVASILTNEGVCEYKPPNKRRVYSRETVLSLRKQQRKLQILNREVGEAILVNP
uniref:Tudor domain-containing protein n=1 Tax=Setaria digitata TaxID=48799 RepID=A0A915Q3M2_9BILA